LHSDVEGANGQREQEDVRINPKSQEIDSGEESGFGRSFLHEHAALGQEILVSSVPSHHIASPSNQVGQVTA